MGFNIKKLGRVIKKGIGQGIGGINKVAGQVIKTIGKETGKLDRATGGLLGDIAEETPILGQAMKGYQLSKKALKTSQDLQGALEGKKSFKSVIRDTELIPDKFKDEALMAYEEGADEFGRQMKRAPQTRKDVQNMAIKLGRRYYNPSRGLGDQMGAIKPAVERDLVGEMKRLQVRNPILAGRLQRIARR